MLGHLRCRIRYNLEIGAGLQWVVARKASYTILRSPNGNRYTLYFYFNDGKWNWNYNWLDNDRNANNPSAVLATIFISSPAYLVGEFCFVSWPLQPPSILPISSIFTDSAI